VKELYIKELSIIDGGIGCAVWDAAIILSRFIYENADLFRDKIALELGAGVGLPGITAARFAERCYLTDYIETIQTNLEYNVRINSISEDDDEDIDNDDKFAQTRRQHKIKVGKSSHVCLLNWDDIKTMENPQPEIPLHGVDILLGSELTYTGNENTINCLIEVVLAYMARPNGIFIELLSDDRDGVSQFLADSARCGIIHRAIPVPSHFLGNYGTKQQPETYKIFLFAREQDLDQNELYHQVCSIFDRYEANQT
jgi:predicted nicotinamide N-methyase